MKTLEDIESYLIRTELNYSTLGEGMWVIKDQGPDLVVSIAGPVVVFRVKVLDLSRVAATKQADLYRTLLQFNATEMLHGAYGLEENAVVMTDALQLENLDFNEFQATVDDIGMALSKHFPTLAQVAQAA